MENFENIPELRGAENFYQWRRQTEQLLLSEGVYNHISRGTNPFNYVEYASVMLQPVMPGAPTAAEQELIRTWIKEDGLAKSIILRKISTSVLALIPDNIAITAREIWTTLTDYYDRADISLQFSIRAQIAGFQMKSAADAEKYVAAHTLANEQLARMGAKPTGTEMVYALIRGLPKTGPWPFVRKNIETEMERSLESSCIAQQSAQLTGSSILSQVPSQSSPLFASGSQHPTTSNPFHTGSANPFLASAPPTPSRHSLSFARVYTLQSAAQAANDPPRLTNSHSPYAHR